MTQQEKIKCRQKQAIINWLRDAARKVKEVQEYKNLTEEEKTFYLGKESAFLDALKVADFLDVE